MTVPIQISAWNINGFRSTAIGDKLCDPSFLTEIKNDELIALVETHNCDKNDSLSIPGYQRISVKNRKVTNSSNKKSGGIAYFAKPRIAKFIVPINNDNKDTLWIKIKKILLIESTMSLLVLYIFPHIRIIKIVLKKFWICLKLWI